MFVKGIRACAVPPNASEHQPPSLLSGNIKRVAQNDGC